MKKKEDMQLPKAQKLAGSLLQQNIVEGQVASFDFIGLRWLPWLPWLSWLPLASLASILRDEAKKMDL